MKLARPDVFHPRIVLVGAHQAAGDDAGLVAALRRRGLAARWLPWDDPDTGQADLVILRSAPDYPDRLTAFLAWTTRVRNLLNSPAAVAWNVDRRYLTELADRGVPTLPGRVYRPGERAELPGTGRIFVGPAVGAGVRCYVDRAAAAARVAELHDAGRGALVQPAGTAAPEPQTVLVFLGGEPSHAFTTQGRALRQGEPDFEAWDVGAAALAAVGAPGELLQARVHLVGDRVLEVQLVDPALGWRRLDTQTRDLAQRRFALCVESALQRLGLGPFSHRSP